MSLDIPPSEMAIIEQYGFQVTKAGDNYVVRDPEAKRRKKYEGHNLLVLLTQVQFDRDEAVKAAELLKQAKENRKATAKPKTKAKKPNGAGDAPPVSEPPPAAEDEPPGSPEGPAASTEPAAPSENEGIRKFLKQKRTQQDWRTYKVGHLILTNPSKTPDELLKMAKAAGIDTKMGTVVGLQRYFALCVKLLADIEAEKKDAAA